MRAGSHAGRQRGFTYLGVLFLMVLMGLALAGTGEAWSLASRRAREKELLWVGNQYARAIRSYYSQAPGVKQYPEKLEDLVDDRRFPETRHHLRQLYDDPIARRPFDIVLSPDGRIGGVHSHSDDEPMKQTNFPTRFASFKGSTHYSDWHFLGNDPGDPRLQQQLQQQVQQQQQQQQQNQAQGQPPGTRPSTVPANVFRQQTGAVK